jgi:hypothetical protein
MQRRTIDNASGAARCGGASDVVDFDLSKICNGASLWLLGVAAACQVLSITERFFHVPGTAQN